MMRGLLAFCLIITMIIPLCQGAVNPVPILSISLDTPSQIANVTANSSAVVEFTGHCGVDKLPVEKVVVELTSSVDKGWNAPVDPSEMVFTSTTPQSFTCTVYVPGGTPGGSIGKLTITGTVTAKVLSSTTHTDATISVEGPAPLNHTGNANNGTKGNAGSNQTANGAGTGPAGGGAGNFLGLSQYQLMMASVAVVILVAAAFAGLYVRVRRARSTVYEINSADDG